MSRTIRDQAQLKIYSEEATGIVNDIDNKKSRLKRHQSELKRTGDALDITDLKLKVVNRIIRGDFVNSTLFEEMGNFETMEDLLNIKEDTQTRLNLLSEKHHTLSLSVYQTRKDLRILKSRLKTIKKMIFEYYIDKMFANFRVRTIR